MSTITPRPADVALTIALALHSVVLFASPFS